MKPFDNSDLIEIKKLLKAFHFRYYFKAKMLIQVIKYKK